MCVPASDGANTSGCPTDIVFALQKHMNHMLVTRRPPSGKANAKRRHRWNVAVKEAQADACEAIKVFSEAPPGSKWTRVWSHVPPCDADGRGDKTLWVYGNGLDVCRQRFGYSLFAKGRSFKKGDAITQYIGRVVTRDEATELMEKGEGSHLCGLDRRSGQIIDGIKLPF